MSATSIAPTQSTPQAFPFAATASRASVVELPGTARYLNFDYLRLLLAIEVVAGHMWAGLLRPGSLWVPIPPVAAFVGLSGFLIPQSLERSRNMRHFAWKRIVRTIPALIPLLIAIGIMFGFKRVVGAAEQYLTAGYRGQFLGVTLPLWSLIVEDALYACMALMFVIGIHKKAWVTIPILAGLILWSSHITNWINDYRLFHTSIAFFTGNLIYIFYERIRKISWVWPAIVCAASLLGWLNFTGRVGQPILIASVIVLAITLPQMKWKIPDLSYGIYIWHAPILLALLAPIGMARDTPWVIATCVLSVIAALLSWYLVEKRALRKKNGPPPWLQIYWSRLQSAIWGPFSRDAAAPALLSPESLHAHAPLAPKKAG